LDWEAWESHIGFLRFAYGKMSCMLHLGKVTKSNEFLGKKKWYIPFILGHLDGFSLQTTKTLEHFI